MAIKLPSVATSTDQPGRMTDVVSRSSTTAGPSNLAPAPSSDLRYTGASIASEPRPNTIGRCDTGVGGPSAAACHVARTIVRRAERRVYTLSKTEDVRPEVMRYLNRLSDLLFVVARVLARAEHGTEVLWNRKRS